MSFERDPERQLSIEGAHPGLSVGELRQLGWRRKSKEKYVLGQAWAETTDGRVHTVHGEALRLGPNVVLKNAQPVSANWSEVFQALSLPSTPAMETQVLGPLRRGDILDFPDWGFQVFLSKNSISSFQMERPFVIKPGHMVDCQLLQYGVGIRKRYARLESARSALPTTKSWSISGVFPGMTLKQLRRRGWTRKAGPNCYPMYELTADPKADIVFDCERSTVLCLSGCQLQDPSGKLVLQRNQQLSPDLHEIFEALGLDNPQLDLKPGHDLTCAIEFEDIGLTVFAWDQIEGFRLASTPGNPFGSYLGKVSCCEFKPGDSGWYLNFGSSIRFSYIGDDRNEPFRVPLDTTRYQIEEIICREHSRWAQVYDALLNQAVKAEWYWLEDDLSKEALDRLRQDHLAIEKLCHPGIVRIYQCQQDGGQTLLLSEPSAEGTLRDLLEAGPIALESALEILHRVAELLDYAHQHRIVHRCVEPDHILVGSPISASNVKIRQFGIAWILNLRYLQKKGRPIPTKCVSYFSPEQASGYKVDRRGDIFSLGVILYEMLVGKRPFGYEWAIPRLVWEICHSPVEFPADFDPKFRVILERCLAKDRESRFQNIAELMDALGLSRQGWSQPELAQPHMAAGNQHYQEKRFEEALQEWTKALELDRYNAITHNNLGTAYDSLGDLEQAERSYRQALELTPYQMVGYYNLASVQSRLDEWEEAALNYRRSAILAPEHALSHYNLARCYHHLGRIGESQASLERAYQLNPELDNPPAWSKSETLSA